MGAIILSIEDEKEYYGEHINKMSALKKLAKVQSNIVDRMLKEEALDPQDT